MALTATPDPTGMLLVDKPPGMTSHEAVLEARSRLGIRRIGHTGTLDPFATGLLLLLVGPFTRATQYFHILPKRYTATMRLGIETDTEDRTGTPVAENEAWRDLSEGEVRRALAVRSGEGTQLPPRYSAKRVGGRRAHAEARRGARLELAPIPITVHGLSLERFEPPLVGFTATVSTGTYVRSLARDIGRDLGCGAHLSELRRTRIGPFPVAGALPPERVGPPGPATAAGWRSPAEALGWLPRRRLDPPEVGDIRHGRAVSAGAIESPTEEDTGPLGLDGPAAVALLADGALVAVAERHGEELRPRKVFAT